MLMQSPWDDTFVMIHVVIPNSSINACGYISINDQFRNKYEQSLHVNVYVALSKILNAMLIRTITAPLFSTSQPGVVGSRA